MNLKKIKIRGPLRSNVFNRIFGFQINLTVRTNPILYPYFKSQTSFELFFRVNKDNSFRGGLCTNSINQKNTKIIPAFEYDKKYLWNFVNFRKKKYLELPAPGLPGRHPTRTSALADHSDPASGTAPSRVEFTDLGSGGVFFWPTSAGAAAPPRGISRGDWKSLKK